MTHITCRLTAKNRDQLRGPYARYRVWAAFFTFHSQKLKGTECGWSASSRSWRRRVPRVPVRLLYVDISGRTCIHLRAAGGWCCGLFCQLWTDLSQHRVVVLLSVSLRHHQCSHANLRPPTTNYTLSLFILIIIWLYCTLVLSIIFSISSPPHSFIPGLKPSSSANPSHRSLLYLFFRTDSTDSPDCLPILLGISVFDFTLPRSSNKTYMHTMQLTTVWNGAARHHVH